MAVTERVHALVEPIVLPLGLELVDVELNGGLLRVTVDREGGVDVDALSRVSRLVSRALDEDDPVNGRYTLEVSSPGLERTLRTPAHYVRARGERVSVKLGPHVEGDRRYEGALSAADETGITVVSDDGIEARIDYDDITRARTVFVWDGQERRRGATR